MAFDFSDDPFATRLLDPNAVRGRPARLRDRRRHPGGDRRHLLPRRDRPALSAAPPARHPLQRRRGDRHVPHPRRALRLPQPLRAHPALRRRAQGAPRAVRRLSQPADQRPGGGGPVDEHRQHHADRPRRQPARAQGIEPADADGPAHAGDLRGIRLRRPDDRGKLHRASQDRSADRRDAGLQLRGARRPVGRPGDPFLRRPTGRSSGPSGSRRRSSR